MHFHNYISQNPLDDKDKGKNAVTQVAFLQVQYLCGLGIRDITSKEIVLFYTFPLLRHYVRILSLGKGHSVNINIFFFCFKHNKDNGIRRRQLYLDRARAKIFQASEMKATM